MAFDDLFPSDAQDTPLFFVVFVFVSLLSITSRGYTWFDGQKRRMSIMVFAQGGFFLKRVFTVYCSQEHGDFSSLLQQNITNGMRLQ
jgi:hypothetical protein